ncbi:hypothetical protein BGW38_001334 [Lunasporangiospora selenospora]|uniref:Uncharacterized protein n=1 Tax=Lunasporangiospora selenospora TaxID=979761 RepID=A0A9P6FUT9_9FUNG|nr:hypothetical protein BGW38_001334 [Lunasporangiospora selenospora]
MTIPPEPRALNDPCPQLTSFHWDLTYELLDIVFVHLAVPTARSSASSSVPPQSYRSIWLPAQIIAKGSKRHHVPPEVHPTSHSPSPTLLDLHRPVWMPPHRKPAYFTPPYAPLTTHASSSFSSSGLHSTACSKVTKAPDNPDSASAALSLTTSSSAALSKSFDLADLAKSMAVSYLVRLLPFNDIFKPSDDDCTIAVFHRDIRPFWGHDRSPYEAVYNNNKTKDACDRSSSDDPCVDSGDSAEEILAMHQAAVFSSPNYAAAYKAWFKAQDDPAFTPDQANASRYRPLKTQNKKYLDLVELVRNQIDLDYRALAFGPELIRPGMLLSILPDSDIIREHDIHKLMRHASISFSRDWTIDQTKLLMAVTSVRSMGGRRVVQGHLWFQLERTRRQDNATTRFTAGQSSHPDQSSAVPPVPPMRPLLPDAVASMTDSKVDEKFRSKIMQLGLEQAVVGSSVLPSKGLQGAHIERLPRLVQAMRSSSTGIQEPVLMTVDVSQVHGRFYPFHKMRYNVPSIPGRRKVVHWSMAHQGTNGRMRGWDICLHGESKPEQEDAKNRRLQAQIEQLKVDPDEYDEENWFGSHENRRAVYHSRKTTATVSPQPMPVARVTSVPSDEPVERSRLIMPIIIPVRRIDKPSSSNARQMSSSPLRTGPGAPTTNTRHTPASPAATPQHSPDANAFETGLTSNESDRNDDDDDEWCPTVLPQLFQRSQVSKRKQHFRRAKQPFHQDNELLSLQDDLSIQADPESSQVSLSTEISLPSPRRSISPVKDTGVVDTQVEEVTMEEEEEEVLTQGVAKLWCDLPSSSTDSDNSKAQAPGQDRDAGHANGNWVQPKSEPSIERLPPAATRENPIVLDSDDEDSMMEIDTDEAYYPQRRSKVAAEANIKKYFEASIDMSVNMDVDENVGVSPLSAPDSPIISPRKHKRRAIQVSDTEEDDNEVPLVRQSWSTAPLSKIDTPSEAKISRRTESRGSTPVMEREAKKSNGGIVIYIPVTHRSASRQGHGPRTSAENYNDDIAQGSGKNSRRRTANEMPSTVTVVTMPTMSKSPRLH